MQPGYRSAGPPFQILNRKTKPRPLLPEGTSRQLSATRSTAVSEWFRFFLVLMLRESRGFSGRHPLKLNDRSGRYHVPLGSDAQYQLLSNLCQEKNAEC